MIRCPACDAILFRRRAGGLEVDGCASCGGLWLDKGELRGLLERPDARLAVTAAVRPGIQPPTGVAGRRACPRCETALTPGQLPAAREVKLDGCQTCGGVWLDAGELEAIAGRVSPEPVNVPAPEAAAVAGQLTTPPLPADPTRTAALPLVRRDLLPQLAAPSGFFDGVGKGLTLVGATFRMAKECPALLRPAAIGAVLDLALGGAVIAALLSLQRSGYFDGAEEAGSDSRAWMVAAGIGVLFVFRFVHVVVSGMTVSGVDAFLKGRPPSLKTAFRDVLQNLGGLFTLAVVATVVELLISFLRGSGRRRGLASAAFAAVGAGLAAAIEAAWTVLSFMLLPVIIVEDVGLGTALRRVRDLHRRNIVAAAAGHLGIRTVMGLVGFVVFAVVGALAFAVWPPSLGQLIALAAVFLFALTAVGLVRAYATGAYYTFMYLWAAEVEREGAVEEIPATFRPAWS